MSVEEGIAQRGRRRENGGHSISGPFSVNRTEWVSEYLQRGDKGVATATKIMAKGSSYIE